jgi:hypothetical protein
VEIAEVARDEIDRSFFTRDCGGVTAAPAIAADTVYYEDDTGLSEIDEWLREWGGRLR